MDQSRKQFLKQVNEMLVLSGLEPLTESEYPNSAPTRDDQQPAPEEAPRAEVPAAAPEVAAEEQPAEVGLYDTIQEVKACCERGECTTDNFEAGSDQQVVFAFVQLLSSKEGLELCEAADALCDALYEEVSEEQPAEQPAEQPVVPPTV